MTTVPLWKTPDDVPSRPSIRGAAGTGALIALTLFGGIGGWAATAPLSSAAIAPGTVQVESHRKTVQHLDGGIVREILVREGDKVIAGQVLMRLDNTQSATTVALLQNQYDALKALETRLLAERDGASSLRFSDELERRRSDPGVAAILDGQKQIFESRRQTLAGQLGILARQVDQLGAEIQGYRAQVTSIDNQYALIQDELQSVAEMVAKGLERRPRLLALQRDAASLQGNKGQQQGLIAKAQQAIGEAKMQSADLVNRRADEVALELQDAQSRLAEIAEKLHLAADINHRMDVLAPVAGQVVDLQAHTVGGIIRPGEPILDIVPENDDLVIAARVQPTDIDVVHVGEPAQVSLPAYKQRITPRLDGVVTAVSADALTSEDRRTTYYEAQIRIDHGELEKLDGVKLYPGMPAEVMVVTGERSLLRYLCQPLLDSFHRAFREE